MRDISNATFLICVNEYEIDGISFLWHALSISYARLIAIDATDVSFRAIYPRYRWIYRV